MCYSRAVVHKERWAGTQDIAVGIVAFPDFEQNSEGGFDVINASGDIEFDTIPRLQFWPLMKLRRIRRTNPSDGIFLQSNSVCNTDQIHGHPTNGYYLYNRYV